MNSKEFSKITTMISEMNQLHAIEIKLVHVDKLVEKESKILKLRLSNTWNILMMVFSPLSFFLAYFFKKNSEMRSKIEQLQTRLQDSELEVS